MIPDALGSVNATTTGFAASEAGLQVGVMSQVEIVHGLVAMLAEPSYSYALARCALAWEQPVGCANETDPTVEARRDGPIAPGMRAMDEENRPWKR